MASPKRERTDSEQFSEDAAAYIREKRARFEGLYAQFYELVKTVLPELDLMPLEHERKENCTELALYVADNMLAVPDDDDGDFVVPDGEGDDGDDEGSFAPDAEDGQSDDDEYDEETADEESETEDEGEGEGEAETEAKE